MIKISSANRPFAPCGLLIVFCTNAVCSCCIGRTFINEKCRTIVFCIIRIDWSVLAFYSSIKIKKILPFIYFRWDLGFLYKLKYTAQKLLFLYLQSHIDHNRTIRYTLFGILYTCNVSSARFSKKLKSFYTSVTYAKLV